VTTIETHEVWIIRRSQPEPPDEAGVLTPEEIAQPATVSPLSEGANSSETDEEEES
jgi:hypothetical protein